MWARLEIKTSGGEEEYSFTSRRQVPSKTTIPTSPNPFTPSNKRKSPSKWRKDNVKWGAWLEKKLEETKVPRKPPSEESPSKSYPSEISDPSLLLQTSPPVTHQRHNNIIWTPGGTTLTVLEPLAMGEGEDVVEDQPLPPGEQPGDDTDMDLNTETEPPVDPGVPTEGLFDPVYAFCRRKQCELCELASQSPILNDKYSPILCDLFSCCKYWPSINWHERTKDCKNRKYIEKRSIN